MDARLSQKGNKINVHWLMVVTTLFLSHCFRSQPEKVVTSPQKPSIKFIGPSMPSLVPYQDDHSSDDEELKIAKKTEVKCPQTGSSSSNELPKPANRPSESPKKPQLNLNQSNNAVSKEEPVVQKTESNDGSQSSTKV